MVLADGAEQAMPFTGTGTGTGTPLIYVQKILHNVAEFIIENRFCVVRIGYAVLLYIMV